ncbi:MAG: NUDIX hydrolase [Candidatus Heimdallarchaeota archaeon]|nr:MAG: NUDIX hydrolase [Candidatus Heimdallarchaeota archaeon]
MKVLDLLKYHQKGNGVILKIADRLLVAVGKESYWDKTTEPYTITYTNTGGHVEGGETIEEATKREVREELGCEVTLFTSETTYYCGLENPNLKKKPIDDKLAPVLVYNSSEIQMSVCVYLAEIISDPFPQREVPAIMYMPLTLLEGGQLKTLLKKGCSIKEQKKNSIPRDAIMQPFDSISIIAENLDYFRKLSFFQRL